MVSEEFPDVVEYVNRASYMLSIGRPTTRIALYFPTTSLWFGDGEADAHVWEITQELLEAQRDFDFVDEQALSSVLLHKDGTLENLSGQRYQTVLIPSIHVISKTALSRLKEFSDAGGQVVFLGDTPPLVVDKTFADAEMTEDFSWAVRSSSGELTDRVMAALPKPDVMLDRPCPPVKVLHRKWADADLYFFFNESVSAQSRDVVLSGSGQVQVWDAETGGIEAVQEASVDQDDIRMRLRLGPYDSKFVVIGALLSDPTPKSDD